MNSPEVWVPLEWVIDCGLYLVPASFARGVHGCKREGGAANLCWRKGGRVGGWGVRPFLLSTKNFHIVAYSLPPRGARENSPDCFNNGWGSGSDCRFKKR